MSDNNLDSALQSLDAQNSSVRPPFVQEEAHPEQPTTVIQEPVKPAKVITAQSIQTAEDTVFKEVVEVRSEFTGDFTEDSNTPFYSAFIGLNKSNLVDLNSVISMWSDAVAARHWIKASDKERAKEQINITECNAIAQAWAEFSAKKFPDLSQEEVDLKISQVYMFMRNIADTTLVQFNIVKERTTNLNKRTSKPVISPDIVSLVPNGRPGSNKLSLSQLMRRTAASAGSEAYQFDLLLRNSYFAMKVNKPGRLELGVLIEDIAKVVRLHVRQMSQNVPALSNIAVYRVIWNFIKKYIEKCSVKDTSDYDELADVMSLNDIFVITCNLLSIAHPRGINFSLSCYGGTAEQPCDWRASKVIDPSYLIRDRKWLDSDEESAVYANSINFSRSYSREEIADLKRKTNYQRDIQPVYNEEQNSCFVLGVPSLTEAFEAEEFFANVVREKLQEFQQTSIDEDQYTSRRDDYLNGLVGTDYLHFISEYRMIPDTSDSTTVIVFKRSGSDPKEFNQGIMNILLDNPKMGAALVKEVIKHYPYMNKTFIGMANFNCPKCKASHPNYEDLGYTPINVVNAFFTLTNLTLSGQTMAGEKAMVEALTNIIK